MERIHWDHKALKSLKIQSFCMFLPQNSWVEPALKTARTAIWVVFKISKCAWAGVSTGWCLALKGFCCILQLPYFVVAVFARWIVPFYYLILNLRSSSTRYSIRWQLGRREHTIATSAVRTPTSDLFSTTFPSDLSGQSHWPPKIDGFQSSMTLAPWSICVPDRCGVW